MIIHWIVKLPEGKPHFCCEKPAEVSPVRSLPAPGSLADGTLEMERDLEISLGSTQNSVI